MELLERNVFVEALAGHLSDAAQRGRMVLVGGEAGIGKTTLLEHVASRHRATVRVLWGACDAQFTPRALGPLLDIADQADGPLSRLARSEAGRDDLFNGFLRELRGGPRPNLVVFEDIHWADDATLDLLRFVARRLATTRTLLLATFRSDEVRPALQVVLGDLARMAGIDRIDLPPLSEVAVSSLAGGNAATAADIYRATGGNPFYVTEVLASPGTHVPQSVRDAVLARAAQLTPGARAALETAALIGPRVDPVLLDRVERPEPGALEECLERGVLRRAGGDIVFRHELAREVLEDAISPTRRLAIERRVLDLMIEAPAGTYDPAQIAHHAEAAGDADAVIAYGTAAAERAASVDAHREAAAQYARVLRFASGLGNDARGRLFRARSYECFVLGDHVAAVAAARASLDCWRLAGDRLAEGDAARWLSRTLLYLGGANEGDALGRAAIELLETLPSGPELAMAYANLSQHRMMAWDHEAAMSAGRRAIELAQQLGHVEARAHALNSMGTSMLLSDDPAGRELVEASISLGREAGLHDDVARGFANLAETATMSHEPALAERFAEEGLALASERELGEHGLFLRDCLDQIRVMQGRWTEAFDSALPHAIDPATPAYIRIMACTVVGRVRARRGERGVVEILDQALELAQPFEQLQLMVPVRIARAEAAWLAGEPSRAAIEVESVFEAARQRGGSWPVGELAFWRWKAAAVAPPSSGVAEPFALQMAGDWAAAAALWEALGCPYESALALTDSVEEGVLRDALARFEELGALPASRIVARRLRAHGAHAVARGPTSSTRANAAGLTRREVDVLELLADGLRNADISERLIISPKTVEHHVSAVLAKLGTRTRGEAVREGRRLGLVDERHER